MRTISQAVQAVWDIGIGGRYFRLLNSGAAVNLEFFRGGQMVYDATDVEPGYYAMPEGGYERVRITTAAPQTVKVGISNGQGGYDTTTASIAGTVATRETLATTIANTAPVNVGVAATELLAADATRRGARFYNAGTSDIYLGGAGVTTANGCIKLAPGQSYFEDDAPGAAWYGIAAVAGQEVRIQGVTQ